MRADVFGVAGRSLLPGVLRLSMEYMVSAREASGCWGSGRGFCPHSPIKSARLQWVSVLEDSIASLGLI